MAKPKYNPRRKANNGGGAGSMAVDSENTSKPPSATVEIRNWQGGSASECVSFLERKSAVKIQNYRVNGDVIRASVRPADASVLRKWSGAKYCTHTLDIRVTDAPSQQASETIQVLTTFLQQRYNPQLKLLNLSAMKNDPLLVSKGLYATPTTASKMFMALMKLAGEQLTEVLSVSLDGNDLTSVESVRPLSDAYPRLLNLSLANNLLQRIGDLSIWTNRFPQLRELVLTGNPLMQPQNVPHIVAMFPRLLILDGVSVRNEADLPADKLPAIKPSFFETPEVQNVAMSFLGDFFRLWDSDKTQLLQLYDEMSEFSLCLNFESPHVNAKPRFGPSPLQPINRNLLRSSTNNVRHHRLFIGGAAVAGAFKKFPRSQHNLNAPGNFAIDAWQLHGVRQPGDTAIVINIHGSYTELDNPYTRSFDRIFTVLPGPGGNMIVASDMLTIRLLGKLPHTASAATPNNSIPQSGPVTPSPTPQVHQVHQVQQGQQVSPVPGMPLGGTPPPHAQVIQAIMAQTRLNAEYAEMCAKQANFDLNTALQLFQQSHAQLPPNAYQL